MKRFAFALLVGIGSLSLALGCNNSKPAAPATTGTTPAAEEHGHSHGHGSAPHDGTIADWGGGKYHIEFTVDHDLQQAVVYILGDDAKTPAPIQAEEIQLNIKEPATQVTLKADPHEGESQGSSRFVGKHENLGKVQEFAGSIIGVIDGTPYTADFQEEAHSHGHGHSHSGDDALIWEGEPHNHAGMVIKLGHHGEHLHAGKEVEPAVSIMKDGKSVSDAKVFNALLDAEGANVLAEEVITVYEPETEEEPAHYAQGPLAIPADVKKVVLRFRIVPASGEEVSFDVPVDVE